MICSATKKDGTPCKAGAKEDGGLCVFHLKNGVPDPVVGVVAPLPGTAPAKLKGLRRARNLRVGLRCITMLRPICRDGCQDGVEVAGDWYKDCPHDPYVGKKQHINQVPVYSAPLADGSVTLERMEDRISWETWPHFVEVALDIVVNSGQGVERGRRKGYILPEELASPFYPAGIAPMCQFRNCRWQEGLRDYRWGTFCREVEARMVGMSATDTSGNLIYGAREVLHEGKKTKQLDEVAV